MHGDEGNISHLMMISIILCIFLSFKILLGYEFLFFIYLSVYADEQHQKITKKVKEKQK